MVRISLLICFVLIAAGCATTGSLEEGEWTGSLAPMNHPDRKTDLVYLVSYPEDVLALRIIGPDGEMLTALEPELRRNELLFSFIEPEQQALLSCRLIPDSHRVYSGRCMDSDGKFALFTMVPPSSGALE